MQTILPCFDFNLVRLLLWGQVGCFYLSNVNILSFISVYQVHRKHLIIKLFLFDFVRRGFCILPRSPPQAWELCRRRRLRMMRRLINSRVFTSEKFPSDVRNPPLNPSSFHSFHSSFFNHPQTDIVKAYTFSYNYWSKMQKISVIYVKFCVEKRSIIFESKLKNYNQLIVFFYFRLVFSPVSEESQQTNFPDPWV